MWLLFVLLLIKLLHKLKRKPWDSWLAYKMGLVCSRKNAKLNCVKAYGN